MKIQILALFFLVTLAFCQIRDETLKPKSLTNAVSKRVHTIVLPHVNVAKELEAESKERGLAPRYGYAHKVHYSINNSGTYERLKDGSRLWRISFKAPGAFFTTIAFKRFVVKAGVTLHIKTKKNFMGAYTYKNVKRAGNFAVGPVHGDEFTLELYEPAKLVGTSQVELKTITHAYKDLFGIAKNGRSGSCNIEAACPQGDPVRNQTRSSGLLLQTSGFRFCSGSLVNNQEGKATPYFLTAFHCGRTPTNWIVMFNYKGNCGQRRVEASKDTISGFATAASSATSDYHLLRPQEDIPASYNVYLSGWNAVDEPETAVSYAVHHPSGDNKKVAVCKTALTNSRWGGGPMGTHWRVNKWDEGTTEPGSSGSPLYNSNGEVVGQLHGGTASCRNPNGWDVYGKVSFSYDNGLQRVLDPKKVGRVCAGADLNELKSNSQFKLTK